MSRNLRFIRPIDRVFLLKRLDSLRNVPPVDLAALGLRAEECSFAAGESLYTSNEVVTRIHMIASGRVQVHGDEHGEVILEDDGVVGALTALAGQSGLEARAESETTTLALRIDDLFDTFETDFGTVHDQLVASSQEVLRLRRRIPAGTYLAPADIRTDLPEIRVELVRRLLYMRQGALMRASMEGLVAMAQRMETAHFDAGTVLWQIGAPSGFLYAITAGKVRCTTEDGTVFHCGPGYPLGNLESQCSASRWYEAVTETPVDAVKNSVDVFLDTLEQYGEMALDFVRTSAISLIQRRVEIRSETRRVEMQASSDASQLMEET